MQRRIHGDMVSGARRVTERAAEPVPAPGRRLSRDDVAWLQRTAGNQATRRLLQRAPVAPATYFKGIADKSGGDPEWDPKWTKALKTVEGRNDLVTLFGNTIDDASESDAHRVLGKLAALKGLSYEKPNPYIAAIDAVRFHFGIESDSGGSGFGSLDTSGTEFEGRPAFPEITQKAIGLKAGQHRRHILAWHDLRDFMQIAYGAQRDTVIMTIAKTLDKPGPGTDTAVAEAWGLVMKSREKTKNTAATVADEEWLKLALFIMNGNPRNLWAGKGTTNSAINTAQMAMNKELGAITTFTGLGQLATKWASDKGKAVYNTSTTLASDVLIQQGTEAESLWLHQGKQPLQEPVLVKGVVAKVTEWVVSNLQLDLLGETKAQTEFVQGMSKELKEPREIIDNVVHNPGLIKSVEPRFVEYAIREFLTYV